MSAFPIIKKEQVRKIIIESFITANPSFKFDKYFKRSYLFTRIANNCILETVTIKVHLAKGKLYCAIKSLLDFSLKDNIYVFDGLLNNHLYLINHQSSANKFPENLYYSFENTLSSYSSAVTQLIHDFNEVGLRYLSATSYKIHDKRIIAGFEYINHLTINKNQLKKEFYEANASAGFSIPKTKHPIFTKLVERLFTIQKGKYDIENHMIAFEFLYKYMHDKTNAQQSDRFYAG